MINTSYYKEYGVLSIVLLLALAVRLAVWHWHTYYPLGGDEQEYLQQALTLLREHRYQELRLMRPPLYGVFLASCIVAVDSLVQRLRLIQVFLSTATIIPMWLLTKQLVSTWNSAQTHRHVLSKAPFISIVLCALSYTLADYATELLTETLFLLGVTTLLWLLMRSYAIPQRHPYRVAALAGVILGLLCLLRSVALPLLVLGAFLLLFSHTSKGKFDARCHALLGVRGTLDSTNRHRLLAALVFVLSTLVIIVPWTMRNYATYGGLILIDTTGAENLWLDNDPAGREAVKAQLYALGEDRLARQQLATRNGIAAITTHTHHFMRKAWQELRAFFALEYTDDMLARPAIWVPPPEVWMRLLLGDGLFVLVLIAGIAGLWSNIMPREYTIAPQRTQRTQRKNSENRVVSVFAHMMVHSKKYVDAAPHVLSALWVLYILVTAMAFHVELRYRLPLYPVLLPYAALWLEHMYKAVKTRDEGRGTRDEGRGAGAGTMLLRVALHPAMLVLCLMLLHKPYPALAWQLGQKHVHLAQAEQALAHNHTEVAQKHAYAALHQDPESVLARVALARVALLRHDDTQVEALLREAIALLPAHPHPHVLRGDMLRQQGNMADARHALAYEAATLQDVQAWSWQRFTTPPMPKLDIGNGLDLGMIRGFHLHTPVTHWRWTTGHATMRLANQPLSDTLRLRLASGRPPMAPNPTVEVRIAGIPSHSTTLNVSPEWNVYTVSLPSVQQQTTPLVVEIYSDTFRPRLYDPASPDNRVLGIIVDWVAVE